MQPKNHMDLVRCKHCNALYDASKNWYYGYYPDCSTTRFEAIGPIPRGHCPVCRKLNEEKL